MNRDRHLQKSGKGDVRGLPKKGGAGKGNWGDYRDDMEEVDLDSSTTNASQGAQKIQVKKLDNSS